MKIEYDIPHHKRDSDRLRLTPIKEQIIMDYIHKKITATQALHALGNDFTYSTSLYALAIKCFSKWVHDGTVTVNNDDFEEQQ